MSEAGARLRAIRELRGRSLRSVARAIQYDHAYLSRVELGQQQPTVDFLRALARELELTDILDAIAVIDRARGVK